VNDIQLGIFGAEREMRNANEFESDFKRGVQEHAKRNYAGLRPQMFFSCVQADHSCLEALHQFTAQRANPEQIGQMFDKPDPDQIKGPGGLALRQIHEQVQRRARPRGAAGGARSA